MNSLRTDVPLIKDRLIDFIRVRKRRQLLPFRLLIHLKQACCADMSDIDGDTEFDDEDAEPTCVRGKKEHRMHVCGACFSPLVDYTA